MTILISYGITIMAKLSSRLGLKDAGGRGLPAKNASESASTDAGGRGLPAKDTLSARMGIGRKK